MDFATDYKDFVTFLYYVMSLSFQILVFVVGTIYLNWRERKQREKDQTTKQLQYDKEQRKQEFREWRQFSKIINMEYIRLTSNGVLQRIQKLQDSLKQIRIFRNFRGLDVLRYMIDDVQHFDSPELQKLRLDLDSIFIQLNQYWSLCFFGEVPDQFLKGRLGRVVSELGQLTLPFFQGTRNETVMKCLKNFRSNRPTIQDNSRELEQEVPYVKYFRFGVENQSYATRTPLTLNVDHLIFNISDATKNETLKCLNKLNEDLNGTPYAKSFVTKLRPKIEDSKFLWIKSNVNDDEIIVNLLHEVRYYIWKGIEQDYDTKLKQNIEQLAKIQKNTEESLAQERQSLTEGVVIRLSKRLRQDLESYLKSEHVDSNPELVSKKLIETIECSYQQLQEIRRTKLPHSPTH